MQRLALALALPARSILLPALLLAGHGALAAAQEAGPGDLVAGPKTTTRAEEPERLAVRTAKLLTLAREGEAFLDNATMLIEDGKIVEVGTSSELDVPEGYELLDVGDRWVMPGLVELHSHVGSPAPFFPNDINDTVYLTNPGLRASPGVQPANARLRRGLAGGVTTILYIPGSGSNIGGQGVLLKIGHGTYEEAELRNPGSMKLAQAGNPESWTVGVSRTFMNWNLRNTIQRGAAYAKRWEDYERGQTTEEPEKDIQLEIFRALRVGDAQISTHTQFGQVVMMTVLMVAIEAKLPVFIDHGSCGGYLDGDYAQEHGVAAILGPRLIATTGIYAFWDSLDADGRILGMAAEYQRRGHTAIGFNTDCVDGDGSLGTPPQEELSLQAAMSLRYGLKNVNLESLRGLTIVPAETVGLGDRIGSLEPGKDADFLVLDGDVADPRTTVERVYTDGELVYDAEEERRW